MGLTSSTHRDHGPTRMPVREDSPACPIGPRIEWNGQRSPALVTTSGTPSKICGPNKRKQLGGGRGSEHMNLFTHGKRQTGIRGIGEREGLDWSPLACVALLTYCRAERRSTGSRMAPDPGILMDSRLRAASGESPPRRGAGSRFQECDESPV